jgi:hypothetical protein
MKKRLGMLLGTTAVLFMLTGCGKSAQDEFVSYMETQSKQTEGTYDFNVAIKELELPSSPETAGNPMVSMMVTQLKDMSITGTMKQNTKKDNAFELDMKVKALGMEVPFNMIGNYGKEPKMYMATDIMEYIMGIMSSMTGMDMTEGTDFSQLKGKYIDVFAMDDKAAWADMVKEMESAQKDQEKLNKKYIDFIKGLDKKSFTKKDNVISHTFTEKDMKDVQNLFKDFEKFNVEIKVDTKKDKTTVTLDMAPKAADSENAGFSSMVLLVETTLKDKKADIVLPKKENILTSEEMEKIFPSSPVAGLNTAVTDEDFNDLKTALVSAKDSLDEVTKKEFLESYKTILTEEQYKEIADILK